MTKYILLLIGIVCLVLIDINLGAIDIPFRYILGFAPEHNPSWDLIIWQFRLPRIVGALFAGAALSVSGVLMQVYFRNDLAGPYVLGISSGAGLAVAISAMSGWVLFNSSVTSIVSALVGAFVFLALIFVVGSRISGKVTLLIMGIMLSSLTNSVIIILQYFSEANDIKNYLLWTMGSFANITLHNAAWLVALLFAGIFMGMFAIKPLNVFVLGETNARTMGVNMARTKALVVGATAILAGGVVAFCGPIGFVGIAVPHLCRFLFRTQRLNTLYFGALFLGALLMVLVDIVTMLPGSSRILPVNAVTSIIGIPIVLYILVTGKKGN